MSTNRGVMCAVVAGLLAAGAVWTASGETNATFQRPREGRGFGDHFMGGFDKLNLTPDQKQKIGNILKQDQQAVKAALAKAREAREALNRQIQSGPFDEQSVRAACKKAAAADEEACVLRANIAGQIRAVLTAEQQAASEKMREEARNAMRKRVAHEGSTTNK